MKCETCGGSVIYHPGNCLEQAALKCMACGRERREKMESKTKKCSRCLNELPIESFHKNRRAKDGLEFWCKDCKSKRQQDYRDKKAGLLRASRKISRQTKVARPLPTITRATPEQIIADLRRGLAIEIIEMIQEKFGL